MSLQALAFVSCINAAAFKSQPVWDWIAAAPVQDLLLLGDSIYADGSSATSPMDMPADQLRQHLSQRYRLQLAQPQFAALLQRLGAGHVDAIWDDHDFLWNEAAGLPLSQGFEHREKLPVTNACFRAFSRAVAGIAPYPDDDSDPALNDPAAPPPDARPSREVAPGVWLHLSDGRSHRTYEGLFKPPLPERQMFGSKQQTHLRQQIELRPDAIHLFASGSTLDTWRKSYGNDWLWLRGLSRQHRILVLSGDIHENQARSWGSEPDAGLPLHEATSSGAACYKLVDPIPFVPRRRNHGLLQFEPGRLVLRFYKDGQEETKRSFAIDRANWQRVPL